MAQPPLPLRHLPRLLPVNFTLIGLVSELGGIVGDLPAIGSFDGQRVPACIDFENMRDAVMRNAFEGRAPGAEVNFVAGDFALKNSL